MLKYVKLYYLGINKIIFTTMKEESKYYTPDIEDLFIGYECELKYTKEWRKEILWNPALTVHKLKHKGYDLRTKYLDKQDIEELSWKLTDKRDPWLGIGYIYEKDQKCDGFNEWGKFTLTFVPNRIFKIHYRYQSSYINHDDYIFDGKCPSVNEYRKIMKLLNITK